MKKCETYELILYFFIAAMIDDQKCIKNYLVYSSSFATFQSFHVAFHLLLVWSSSLIKNLNNFHIVLLMPTSIILLLYINTIWQYKAKKLVKQFGNGSWRRKGCVYFQTLVIKNFHEILIKYWHEWNLPSINVEFQYIEKFKPILMK